MYTIERHFNNERDTYSIYTREEADEEGFDYVYWTEAEPGGWALTDDGFVMKCRRIDTAGKMHFTGATAFPNESSEINFLENHKIGVYNQHTPMTYMAREARTSRAKLAIKFYAKEMIRGVAHSDMPWDIIGNMYRPDEKFPDQTAQRLFRTEEVQDKVAQEIRNQLIKQGFDEEELAKDYKELRKMAKDEGDLTNLRLTLDSVAKLLEQKDDQGRLQSAEVSQTREIEGDIEREERKVKVSRDSE